MDKKARIVGKGSYLPERVLSNEQLEEMVETSDEWIVQRTGMRERRIAAAEESTADMAAAAGKQALKKAGIEASELDLILVATMTPDYHSSSTAALVQRELGAGRAAAFDLQAACTGFLYGLSMAKAYIESGIYRHVLLIASEKMSTVVDYRDRNTCILFGDGASAAVITGEGSGMAIDRVCLGADGEQAELIIIPAGGARLPTTQETVAKGLHTIKLQGKEVFKHAVRRMAQAAEECLLDTGVGIEEIQWLVPHQANIRIIEALAKKFGIEEARIYKTVHKYGNTSASSVAIALDELNKEHTPKPGEHLLLVAFGAGLTWGAALLTCVKE